MKKYEFTGETKQVGFFGNITLKRIRATMEFGIIKIGDLGGWIEVFMKLPERPFPVNQNLRVKISL